LAPNVCEKISLAILEFPSASGGSVQGEGLNALFYPELFSRDAASRVSELAKRAVDIVGSLVALVLFSPLLLIIAIGVKLTSLGPVLFRQQRLGQAGRPFTFLKFRSMYVNNNDAIHREYMKDLIANRVQEKTENGTGATVYKIRNDPRITPIGNFLRKTSLDELPQFFNVLLGEMSLVGPRPPIPYEVNDYDIWHWYRILARKPGITGLWQVRGRSMTTFDGMVRLDIQYIRTWSLWLDFKLLLATPMAVLRGKGAY
jgi:exopolysaccharide biosynthesis polyprenyl glycosylphosphotransferase